jgi:hypothetical protein
MNELQLKKIRLPDTLKIDRIERFPHFDAAALKIIPEKPRLQGKNSAYLPSGL